MFTYVAGDLLIGKSLDLSFLVSGRLATGHLANGHLAIIYRVGGGGSFAKIHFFYLACTCILLHF